MGLLKARDSAIARAADVAAEGDLPRLDHPDAPMRRRAVQALSGDPASVDTLIAVIRDDADNMVRQAAFVALAGLNTGPAAQGVAALLSEADPALRNGALETLAAMPEHAAPLLEPLGRHDDPDVRIFAVLLAGELDYAATADWLLDLGARERDANVCSNLAEALGGCGRGEAVAVLDTIRARFPEEPFLAFAVDTALQRLAED
ncbi:MAG: lyase HEAT-like repeat [Pseudomonadota bacterium]|jgi:HEAT repeat protein